MLKPEVEARVILPAIRAMIAKSLVKNYHFTQSKVASLLGITQATVSNYYREKRGAAKELELGEIEKKVEEIIELLAKKPNPALVGRCLMEILRYVEESRLVCKIHRKLEPWFGEDCDLCFT